MKLQRRRFLRLAAAAALLPSLSNRATAQSYPSRPVKLIVPQVAGSATEILARVMSEWLSERLGQAVTIELQPGAGGTIGTGMVAKAVADGHTLILANPESAISASLYDHLDYSFIKDIAPVAGFVQLPQIMEINSAVPAKTVAEFIAYAKANPGKLKLASTGNGSASHCAGELFKMMAGVDMPHVAYRGGPAALDALLAGEAQLLFSPVPSSIGYVKAGTLRALAVSTSTRLEALPDLPTVGQSVPGFETSPWFGVGAPKATPSEIVLRLNQEINAGLADARMKARLAELGATPMPMLPAEFGQYVADETEKWGKVVKFAGIKVH